MLILVNPDSLGDRAICKERPASLAEAGWVALEELQSAELRAISKSYGDTPGPRSANATMIESIREHALASDLHVTVEAPKKSRPPSDIDP